MTTPEHESVVASIQRRLKARVGQHKQISRESGVPYMTLRHLVDQGEKRNPTFKTIDRLKAWLDAADTRDRLEAMQKKDAQADDAKK